MKILHKKTNILNVFWTTICDQEFPSSCTSQDKVNDIWQQTYGKEKNYGLLFKLCLSWFIYIENIFLNQKGEHSILYVTEMIIIGFYYHVTLYEITSVSQDVRDFLNFPLFKLEIRNCWSQQPLVNWLRSNFEQSVLSCLWLTTT